jgi:hypothetical protein
MDGEIYFNMFKEPHPIYGRSEFLLKRWKRYTIYAKSGSYVRSDNPSEINIHSSSLRMLTPSSYYTIPDSPKANVYSTCSIYLYDYVIVSDTWLLSNAYTASSVDSTPASDEYYAGGNQWSHLENTWHNSPNARTNEYLLTYDPIMSQPVWMGGVGHPFYGPPIIRRDDGTYFEIVRGYPRNHYIHKRGYFALERYTSYGLIGRSVTSASYRKGMQTNGTTIGLTGISDGSDPVQSTQVTNIDLIKSDNVIYH